MIWCTCFVPTHTKYKKCNASLSLGINQAICHFHHISIQIKSGRIWKSLWDVYPSYYYKNQRNITKADDVLFLSCDFLALHTYIRQYRNLNLRKFTYNHMKLMNVILQSQIRVSWSGSSEQAALCDVSSEMSDAGHWCILTRQATLCHVWCD